MKKLLALLSAISVFIPQTIFSYESDKTEITVSDAECLIGEEVSVSIDLENNPGIMAMQMYVEYSSEMTLKEVRRGPALSSLNYTASGSTDVYPFVLLWDGMEDDSSSGTLVTLTFSVPNDLSEWYVKAYSEDGLIYNYDMEDVEISFNEGRIIVLPSYEEEEGTDTPETKKPSASSSGEGHSGGSSETNFTVPTPLTTEVAKSIVITADDGETIEIIPKTKPVGGEKYILAIYDNSGDLIGVSISDNVNNIKLSVAKDKIDNLRIFEYSRNEIKIIAAK